MTRYHVTIDDAKTSLQSEVDRPFTVLLKSGTMQVEYFAPKGHDTQTPHAQDELYFIASGISNFVRENETISCQQGDVLLVPAGMPHHFENFSDDFATWVVFYGRAGGEQKP